MSTDKLYNKYTDSGFYFSQSLITNYCLSLYTKPFVVLSGISGTGKTKIAQLFNPYFPEEIEEVPSEPPRDYITLTMTKGILEEDGRGNFRSDDLKILLTEDEYGEFQKEREALVKKGTADNFSKLYKIFIIFDDDTEHEAEFYVQRAISPLIRIRFKSKIRAASKYDLQPYLKERYNVGDVVQLKKIAEKKFKIVKAHEEEIIKKEEETPVNKHIENICLISVKSDWTDPSGLLGFYNIIEKVYHLGPFLRHLLYAAENPQIPFFVILDEMNLSKVEYYFSDILSILESRVSDPKTNKIIFEEPILLYSAAEEFGDYLATNDEYFDMIPARIKIPTNLFITGTINVDETTSMLSPKVLDRANVIEFNEVDLSNYLADVPPETESNFKLKTLPDFTKIKYPNKTFATSLPNFIKEELTGINDILRQYNMHFGYRVVNEIALYIENTKEFVSDEKEVLLHALDLQTLQKILPKFGGPQAKLENPLLDLLSKFSGSKISASEDVIQKVRSINVSNTAFPRTVEKLKRVFENLCIQGYATFIE